MLVEMALFGSRDYRGAAGVHSELFSLPVCVQVSPVLQKGRVSDSIWRRHLCSKSQSRLSF